MNNYTQNLSNQLENSAREPIFEFEVMDSKGEKDFITCEIYFKGNSIIAERDGVSQKECESLYIATNKLVVDDAFGLDEHLQGLHNLVVDSINEGGLFTIVG